MLLIKPVKQTIDFWLKQNCIRKKHANDVYYTIITKCGLVSKRVGLR